ncbi:MAG TPA: hypothetical protein PKZ16_02710 [bacterium]|nr:hypothetical protein [bacterium]HPL95385.1 hypothetical protein [bacterium]
MKNYSHKTINKQLTRYRTPSWKKNYHTPIISMSITKNLVKKQNTESRRSNYQSTLETQS